MKVRFKTNLGTMDAKALDLDHSKCCDKCVCDVPEAVGDHLVKRGIAEVVPPAIKAVPPAPEISAKADPAQQVETKAPLAAKVKQHQHKEG